MPEKLFAGTFKRHKNLILLIAVAVLLIIIVIITSNRMIRRMEDNSLGHGLSHPEGDHHLVTTSFHSQ